MALLTNLIKKSVERNLIKKEPSMRETMDRAKDRYEETMREVGDLAVQSARSYAQPRHRGDGHMPTVANIPDPTYQHFALEELQSIILHMTYGEMVEFSGELCKPLENVPQDIMAKAIHQWATNYAHDEGNAREFFKQG